MDIVFDEIEDMPTREVLAHVFWAMTWCGYDRTTIAKRATELAEQVEEIKQMAASERPRPN
jgi:hypothetical protein